MGGIIEKKIQYFFKKNPLFYPIAPTIILKNYKPIKKGKDIYTYINASNPRIYGFQIIEKLKQKHNDIVFHVCINPKNKKYCKRKNINTDNYESYEMDKVIDVYKKCFLCLRILLLLGLFSKNVHVIPFKASDIILKSVSFLNQITKC